MGFGKKIPKKKLKPRDGQWVSGRQAEAYAQQQLGRAELRAARAAQRRRGRRRG